MAAYTYHSRLIRRFKKQASFAENYSPLFSNLCSIAADHLQDEKGWFTTWLMEVSTTRLSFEVPLLLMAGLHYGVLSGDDNCKQLYGFFPTVGGEQKPDKEKLREIFAVTVNSHKTFLKQFIQSAAVQTNETGRGICWLLPLSMVLLDRVNLVELGASAGLNLVADRRCYCLKNSNASEKVTIFGKAGEQQFVVETTGNGPEFPWEKKLPTIISRTGCDIAPLLLESKAEELLFASFIWGDQAERMKRLVEGIAAFRAVNVEETSIVLKKTDIPDELPQFLKDDVVGLPDGPVVLFNSYLTNYLTDRGLSLFSIIHKWALQQERLVIWIKMDTPPSGKKAPHDGWLLWSADCWENNQHYKWDFAWCHPHGTKIIWQPGFNDWISFWKNR